MTHEEVRQRIAQLRAVIAFIDAGHLDGEWPPGASDFFAERPDDTWHIAYTRAKAELVDLDRAPAPKPEPVVRVGQVWRGNFNKLPYTVTAVRDGRVEARTEAGYCTNRPVAEFLAAWSLLTDAPPQPVEPPKPAVMCEYPDALGRQHALTTTTYDCCAVCGASASDRRAARRRAFDACPLDFATDLVGNETTYVARQVTDAHVARGPLAPTRELAIEQLWQKLEAKREAGRG